jgi:protein-S-isoprenylcysteine O-methyltransferase Ste14
MEALSAGGSGKRWRGRSTDAVTIKSGMVTAFEAVDAEGQESLEPDLIDLIDPTTVRKSMVVQSDYPEVVATRMQTTIISDLPGAGNSSPSWRWDNIPLPEPHVAGILTSGVLQLTRPWRLPGSRRLYGSAGWTLAGIGIAISALAVRAASDVALERSSTLIFTGPYAFSRNPMYFGWTLLYLGATFVTRNAWMVASLPIVVSLVHREVLREEQILEQAFGEEYLRYQKLVPRYL